MQTTTIKPPIRFGIIVKGDAAQVARAVADRIADHRPIRNVHVNGYEAVHCDVWAMPDELAAWYADSHHFPYRPGDLCFYLSKEAS